MDHEGGQSVLKAVLTEEQAKATAAEFEKEGATVKYTTVRQTEEQHEERIRLNTLHEAASTFPSMACPGCSFFDLNTPGYCGIEDWDRESVQTLLKHKEKAREDLKICPLSKGTQISQ